MRIAQPLSFITKRIAATIAKRTTLVSFGFIILAGGVIASQNLLTTPDIASAATPPDSCFAFNAGTGTITDYYDNEANNSANPACPRAVDIPSTIGGTSVTAIGSSAFSSSNLTSVTLPDSVTTIGIYAFYRNNLTSVTYKNTTYTSSDPFDPATCFAMRESTLESYNYANFEDLLTGEKICLQTDVTIPDSVTSIGYSAFSSSNLTSVTLPDSVTSIGYAAFSYNNLTSVTLPDSVTTIDSSAFYGNNLTSVALPDSVTTISSYAFRDNNLTSVTIPDSVTTIGEGAFSSNNLTSVTLLGSVTTIDNYAFSDNNLTSVTIEDNPAINDAEFALGGVDWSALPEGIDRWSDEWLAWYRDNAQLVAIYANDPAFIAANQDTLYVDEWGGDIVGGHVINPAPITLNYLGSDGSGLAASRTLIGSNPALQSYRLANFIDMTDPGSPELDQTALATLYRVGDEIEVIPPAIEGYVTPAPQAKTLVAGDNTLDFTYNRPVLSVPFVSNDVADGVLVPSTTPGSVASPLLSESKLSIANDSACSTIQSAKLLAPGSVTAPQDITILGGLGFTLDCMTAATTTVSLTLGSQANPDTLRVYKDIAGTLTDITSQVTFTTNNGKTVLSYTLTDGGALDEDGIANGTIVDPIFIGTTGEGGELASTGVSLFTVAGAAAVLVATGAALLRRSFARLN